MDARRTPRESNVLSERSKSRGRTHTVSPECYAYILRCSDGSYYVGCTGDPQERVRVHNSGGGPRYTASRLPVQLLYVERFGTMEQGRRREVQIKRWSRAKKEALISGNLEMLKELSNRRT